MICWNFVLSIFQVSKIMSMNSPMFSVIVPTFNHGHLIGRCIESVLSQTYAAWEMIIVNNYSTDNTNEVVASYHDPRIHIFNFSNNGVIAASRNHGIRQARGQFIAFLDSDDWWFSDKLARISEYVSNNDVIYHDLQIHTPTGKKLFKKIKGRQLSHCVFVDLMVNGNALPNSATVVRRSLIFPDLMLSEDRDLITVEDFDLWLRLSQVSDRFKYIERSLGVYWVDGSNSSENHERSILATTSLYRKFIQSLPKERDKLKASSMLRYIVGVKRMRLGCDGMSREFGLISLKNLSARYRIKALFRCLVCLF